jgi:serine palmitoyltransferase
MDVVRHQVRCILTLIRRLRGAAQRINSPAVVYSAALPPMMAACSTEALFFLTTPTPNANGVPMLPLSTLEDNVTSIRSILDKVPGIEIPSDPLSPLIHFTIKTADMPLPEQARVLQEIVDEALNNGVLLTRAAFVAHQEMVVRKPSVRLCVSAGLTRKECEKSGNVIKSAVTKVLKKR